MAIKINDIPPEGLAVELSRKLDLFDDGASTDCTAALTIKPAGSGIFRLTGSIQAETSLECSRCLKRFPFRIRESELHIELMPGSSLKQEGAEHELGRGELDVEFYQGDEIEPLDLIKEQLLLSVPMVPLHSPDCKGLCTVCGADLNIKECGCSRDLTSKTGPFSQLKDILKKKE